MIKYLLDFISSVGWPLTVIFTILFFRKELREIISRLKEASLPWNAGLKFDFPKENDTKNVGNEIQGSAVNGKWEKIGNIYWLASDLSYSWEALALGADKARISHCINQTMHHLEELNLNDNKFKTMVGKIKGKIDEALDSELTKEFRSAIANDLFSIRIELGHYISAGQNNFKGFPNR